MNKTEQYHNIVTNFYFYLVFRINIKIKHKRQLISYHSGWKCFKSLKCKNKGRIDQWQVLEVRSHRKEQTSPPGLRGFVALAAKGQGSPRWPMGHRGVTRWWHPHSLARYLFSLPVHPPERPNAFFTSFPCPISCYNLHTIKFTIFNVQFYKFW